MNAPEIRPLGQPDIDEATRLLGQLNPDTPMPLVKERLSTIMADHGHYFVVGAFDGGRMVGLCGAWVATKIWCGKYLEIDNLVVDAELRSGGIGSALIRHLEELGHKLDCRILVLDSYTANHPSHRLYHRLGFEIWGFHFVKPIGDWSGKGSA
jgi:ribosomal protein S18 acetylase RimI-like enzyme